MEPPERDIYAMFDDHWMQETIKTRNTNNAKVDRIQLLVLALNGIRIKKGSSDKLTDGLKILLEDNNPNVFLMTLDAVIALAGLLKKEYAKDITVLL